MKSMTLVARGSPGRELATLPPIKYSHPIVSRERATRSATSRTSSTGLLVLGGSGGIVRHRSEQPDRSLAPVESNGEAHPDFLLICLRVSLADSGDGKLPHGPAELHGRFQTTLW